MSNETQHSHNQGDSRRRRSRGGKNNRNQNQDRNRRDQRGQRDQGRSNSNRSEEFRPQGPRPPRGHVPVKLSWWQKLLQAIGLYKAPVRPEIKPQPQRKQEDARPPKSNTRNARTNEGESAAKSGDRGERPERGERPDRGERPPRKEGRGRDRGGDRPRGGDRSTVESPRVYVGNLSYDVTEQDLQELFKGVGPVRNVEIVYNRTTHRSKGYGFVEMLHMDEAIRAVEVLNDQFFMGRQMTVSGAKSKGQDEREEREERPEREARPVVLAPLPAAGEPSAPAAGGDAVIPTIVESVSPEESAAAVAELAQEEPPAQAEHVAQAETAQAIEEEVLAEAGTQSTADEESKAGVA
jgi:RNA recognition motif. (a.k.a. RRM, RBD, or RNP domain)